MVIGGLDVNQRVFIVAEVGNNHEGDFRVATELVHKAAQCRVDAVKFQTYRTEHYISRTDEVRFKRLKSFELTFRQFEELAQLARSLGLRFLSTPFDLESAGFLEPLVDAYKIASGDNTFFPLIESVCKTGKPLIVSTGLSDVDLLRGTHRFIEEQWRRRGFKQEVAFLHCVSSYPVPAEQANLASIQVLRSALNATIGYSDHTIGIEAAVLAVAAGARIIEKHFTLDKHFSDFRDHQLSADPAEMALLVTRVREAERLLGSPDKRVQPCEESAKALLRRSIVARADLKAGHRVQQSDLTWVRPAGGLAPGEEARLIGKTLRRNVRVGEPLREGDVAERSP
jgi:N,N'-diacetyllegionaminate synthase